MNTNMKMTKLDDAKGEIMVKTILFILFNLKGKTKFYQIEKKVPKIGIIPIIIVLGHHQKMKIVIMAGHLIDVHTKEARTGHHMRSET